MAAKPDSPWRNPWFLGWMGLLIAFLMGNSVMIYITTSSVGPGLVVDDYYDRGQSFEDNMLKRKAKDPGWKMKVVMPEFVEVAAEAIINFTVKDAAANPVNRDSVVFHVYRPSDSRQDFEVPMQRIDDGLYEAHVSFPLPGVWDVLVTVPNDDIEINFPQRVNVSKK